MKVYKTIKLCILLVTGILVSCAPDQQQDDDNSNNTNSTSRDQKKITSATITDNKSQTIEHAPGLRVFIDPDTGKFLDKPPPGYVEPPIKSTQKNSDNSQNATQDQNAVNQEQKSTTPGGGYYIKIPPPY